MNVNDEQRIVEIWLTNREKQSAQLSEQLAPLYREYKEKKYLVAVFQSGGQDLLGVYRRSLHLALG